MLNRWIEDELLDVLEREGVGCIVFSPLAQGMLTDKYLHGIPDDSRGGAGRRRLRTCSASRTWLAFARSTRSPPARPDARSDGARLGAARPARDLGADRRQQRRSSSSRTSPRCALDFNADELAEIDEHAQESGINLWAGSSTS